VSFLTDKYEKISPMREDIPKQCDSGNKITAFLNPTYGSPASPCKGKVAEK